MVKTEVRRMKDQEINTDISSKDLEIKPEEAAAGPLHHQSSVESQESAVKKDSPSQNVSPYHQDQTERCFCV